MHRSQRNGARRGRNTQETWPDPLRGSADRPGAVLRCPQRIHGRVHQDCPTLSRSSSAVDAHLSGTPLSPRGTAVRSFRPSMDRYLQPPRIRYLSPRRIDTFFVLFVPPAHRPSGAFPFLSVELPFQAFLSIRSNLLSNPVSFRNRHRNFAPRRHRNWRETRTSTHDTRAMAASAGSDRGLEGGWRRKLALREVGGERGAKNGNRRSEDECDDGMD